MCVCTDKVYHKTCLDKVIKSRCREWICVLGIQFCFLWANKYKHIGAEINLTLIFIQLSFSLFNHWPTQYIFFFWWLLSPYRNNKVQDVSCSSISISVPAVVVLTGLDMNTRVLFVWDQDETQMKWALFLKLIFGREILILVFFFFSVFGWPDQSDSLQTDPWTWQGKKYL